MKVVGRERLQAFCVQHADARKWIENWLFEVEVANWSAPGDITARFPSASFLAGNVVIFNVKGNDYRLEVTAAYKTGVVVVKWAGTHSDYDRRNRQR